MQLILQSLKLVYKKPGYVILTILTAGLILLFGIWLQNYKLLFYTFTTGFSWLLKIKIFLNSLAVFKTSFTTINQILIICLALLSGINISFLIFYLKNRISNLKLAGSSGLALFVGFLGIGCGACGSVILASVFGLTFATGLIGLLPFNGLEFGLLGIILISTSIYLLTKKISQPGVC